MRPAEPAFLAGGSCANMANKRQYRTVPIAAMVTQKMPGCGLAPVALLATFTPVRRDHRCVATAMDCRRNGGDCKGAVYRCGWWFSRPCSWRLGFQEGLFTEVRGRRILGSPDAGSCIDAPSEPRVWSESASTT